VNFVTPSSFSQHAKFASQKAKKTPDEKSWINFRKVLDFLFLLWYVVVLTEKNAQQKV